MTINSFGNFDKKYKEKTRKALKYKIIAAVAVFLILLIGVFYAVVYSPLFKIKKISLTYDDPAKTGERVDENALISNLKDFFASRSRLNKFLGSDSLLIWNGKKLDNFGENSEISGLSLKKDYTNRTVEITVKLRQKFGAWCLKAQINSDQTQINSDNIGVNQSRNQSESKCMWFDKNGFVFAAAPALEGNLINKVDDFSGRDLNIGDSVLDANLAENLIKIFGVLERSGLKIKSLRLENLSLQEIVFDQPQSSLPKLYFSLREDPEFILAALDGLKQIGFSKIDYADFRVENKAYYKVK